jgi:hypothetical protein
VKNADWEKKKHKKARPEDTYSYLAAADQSSNDFFLIRNRMLIQYKSCSGRRRRLCSALFLFAQANPHTPVIGQSFSLGSTTGQPCDGVPQNLLHSPAFVCCTKFSLLAQIIVTLI